MKIIDVYKKFVIPPNLQNHMLRVCGIVEFIQKHWTGKKIDWDLVKTIALLHDLGNVVKFDLVNHPEFLGDEQVNVEYWKIVQKKLTDKYGSDDHEATKKMLDEIGIGETTVDIILNKSFGNSVKTKDSDNWPLKILYYSDLRTLPFGIGTLEERLSDVKARMPQYTSRHDFDNLIDACRELESQIQQNLDIPVDRINDSVIKIGKSFLDLVICCDIL